MRDLKYDIARSFAMIWIVGIYHMSEYVSLPLHTQQWARIVTWSCLGVFTFISAYFLSGKNTFFNFSDIFLFYNICVGGCICSTRFDFRANEIVCIQMFLGGRPFRIVVGCKCLGGKLFHNVSWRNHRHGVPVNLV